MLRVVVALCLVGAALSGPPVSRTRSEIEEFRDFLESTRTDRGVVLGQRGPQNPHTNTWQNSGKYQGDILLDDEQVESMVEQFSAGKNAYTWPGSLWPSRTVVYDFAPGHFNAVQRDFIEEMTRVLEDRTCIRFRRRYPGEYNYVLLTGYSDGCYASVGYWNERGVHTLNLDSYDPAGHGCLNPIVIIHEWLHVIGFFHMQSTHDRDYYVRINWQNVVRGMEHNFERYESNLVSNLGLPYEYDSCMHYGPYDFSMNGKTTMDALRPHHGVMGQSEYVTGMDFWRVDRHYGCDPWRKPQDYQPFYFDGTVAEEEISRQNDAEEDVINEYIAKEEVVNEEALNDVRL